MTMSQDKDVNWISIKDLRKKKICPQCHKPMTVKQINLTEACRSCFNEECCLQPMDVPDIEYIIRSYQDMELGVEKQGCLNVPLVSLEKEVDNINKLFSEVENMVSHRLGKEYRNEMNIPSSSKKQTEDFNGLKFSDKLSHDQCDSFMYNQSQNFQTEISPLLHFEQSADSNGISTDVGFPNIPQTEEKSLEPPWSLHTGNTTTVHSAQTLATHTGWNNFNVTSQSAEDSHEPSWSVVSGDFTSIHTEQTPATNDVWDNLNLGSQAEGKSLDLQRSPHTGNTTLIHTEQTPMADAACVNVNPTLQSTGNSTSIYTGQTPAVDAVLESVHTNSQPEGKSLELSKSPHTGNTTFIHIGQTPATDTVGDHLHFTFSNGCEKSSGLPFSVFDLGQCANDVEAVKDSPVHDTTSNFVLSNDSIVNKGPVSSLNTFVNFKDVLVESNVNVELKTVKILKYESSSSALIQTEDVKRQTSNAHQEKGKHNNKTKVTEDLDLSVKMTNNFRCYRPKKGPHRKTKAGTESQTCDNSSLIEKWSSVSVLFKDSDARSIQHSDVSAVQALGQVIEVQETVALPEENCSSKVNDKLQLFKEDVNVNLALNKESSSILFLDEPRTSDPTKSIKSVPTGKEKVLRKRVPANSDSGSAAKTSPSDAQKKTVKPVLGFTELRSFGGAKCSFTTRQVKPKTKNKYTRRKKTTSKKTESKKTESNSVNDDIEKAIAEVQHSSLGNNIEWHQMFFDLLN